MTLSVAVLARVAGALRGDRSLPPDEARHVAASIERYLAGQAPTLDAAFGLDRQPGQRDERTVAAHGERDDLIRSAAARFYAGMPTTGRAERLHAELLRFETTCWVRERAAEHCPTRHHGTVREACWHILRLHGRSLSARSIRRTLAMK